MQSSKSGLQITFELLLRLLSASGGIYLLISFIAIVRGITQEVESNPLASDDPFLVAFFLSLWLLIPAIPGSIARHTRAKRTGLITYWAVAVIQTAALYLLVHLMALDPESEVASSALPLLVLVALPIAAIYYFLFFYGKSDSAARKVLIGLGAVLVLYGHLLRPLLL